MVQVLMPQLGETVTEGTVIAWFKRVGDPVAAGDNLFEVETDKATMEVQAVSAGTLREIRAKVGDTLPVGAVVAVIASGAPNRDAADADPIQDALRDVESKLIFEAERTSPASGAAPVATPAPSANGSDGGWFGPFSEVRTPARNFGSARRLGDLKVTPLARRLAAEAGIDIDRVAAEVRAAGGWRIAKADITRHAPAADGAAVDATADTSVIPATRPVQHPAAEPVAAPDADLQPLNRIRRKTAEHLSRAWAEVPHVLQAVEVDFHRVEAARGALNAAHEAHWGFRLTYLPFIARAVCLAIRDYPRVNASIEGDRLHVHQRINLGVAVDLAHEGLVVPVVHGADDLNLSGLARAINERIAAARAGRLDADDFSGGTYTISNSGSFGTLITAPIVKPPEVAILSTDGVRKKPVAVETEHGDMVVVRPVGILAQSFDHRAFDGAYSAAFLARLREILETRDWSSDIS